MQEEYVNITLNNIDKEHICCAISDKKHQDGVIKKKEWLKQQIQNGHVFRKLNQNGKIFIEYGPLEKEFVPIDAENYIYIYCFWVSGSFKKKGHGKNLIEYAINDAKEQGKNGICVISANKKLAFLSDKKYLEKYGFKLADKAPPYFELLALPFNKSELPKFAEEAKKNKTDENGLVIYYSDECPYINHCLSEIKEVCDEKNIKLTLHHINTLEQAKNSPCVVNNFAVFYNGEFITHELLNKRRLIEFLNLG